MSDNLIFLVGFAEAVAAPEVCFSLLKTNAKIVCFYRRTGGEKFARLGFVEYWPVAAPEDDANRSLQDIEALVDRFRPELTAPLDDASLFLLSRLNGTSRSRFIPSREACDFAMDKFAQIGSAATSGIPVLKTRLVTNEADIADFEIRPAILKPRAAVSIRNASLEKGQMFFLESNHLSAEARKALCSRSYLIQEYKVGVGEGFFGIAKAGDIYASFGHRRLRMMNPAGSGASACIARRPDLEEYKAVENLVRQASWQGPFMVELLRDDSGTKWFMEFNGRFWGSIALARRCGLDIPKWSFDSARGEAISRHPQFEPGFARHLGRDLINLFFVFRGRRNETSQNQWPTRFSALKQFLRPNRLRSFYNYDPSQPFFFLREAMTTVINVLMRKK
jgi:hypothetical protein